MRDLIKFNDQRYKIIRTLPVDSKPKIDVWKKYLMVDLVLKKNNNFFFCEEIKEVAIIEEKKIAQIKNNE